jgi:hypothetical protein
MKAERCLALQLSLSAKAALLSNWQNLRGPGRRSHEHMILG